VVSLVPSLTESVAVTRPGALAGATDWCTHPADLDVIRVRGTKNPDLAAIRALEPDLVLANQEENRRLDVERLRADGVLVWVTDVRTLDQALASLHRMFTEGLGWPAPDWLDAAREAWAEPPAGPPVAGPPVAGPPVAGPPVAGPPVAGPPVAGPPVAAAIPIWRDPWMVIGSDTFAGDLATRLGLDNVYRGHAARYPKVELAELTSGQAELTAGRPEIIVLPDEPYPFSADDGPEMFPAQRVALVDGRSLTWYGPSLITARSVLRGQLAAARS
jgi:hypothetical protein